MGGKNISLKINFIPEFDIQPATSESSHVSRLILQPHIHPVHFSANFRTSNCTLLFHEIRQNPRSDKQY